MSHAHSMDQYYCQMCMKMGCDKVLDENTIKELESKLAETTALLASERDVFGKRETEILKKLDYAYKRWDYFQDMTREAVRLGDEMAKFVEMFKGTTAAWQSFRGRGEKSE